ncbi:DUF3027 domain-containing protein [Solirubrobacter phytolaccae]|uniref:DUF3027 domain-containing protein n=1 Tax=Solirubrobacter phytolaccae TaxID=1404360 RepID=A0A9X3NCS8_9ACTN|nr:DUF3027 domain-containing protein [Solirubrobacter phytolaccae]MDA0184073.1 DUF3027 domain-containing protein [Solirubrobacter phytolaccae]
MARGTRSLKGSKRHQDATHRRWARDLNRATDSDGYRDEWYREQCGACRWWIPLTGAWGLDWGVCSNPNSQFDARARFEHDGCAAFDEARGGWVVPDESADDS